MNTISPWIYVLIAGLLETGWAISMKYSEGFSKLIPSVVTIVLMVLSFALLSQAMVSLPVGSAYAVWTGIGAIGAVLLGIILFHESMDFPRILCIAAIIGGVIGLKFI